MKDFIVFTPSEVDIDEILLKNNLNLDGDYLKYVISYVLNGLANFIEHYDKESGELIKLDKKYVKMHSQKDVLVRNNKHREHIKFLISDFEEYTYMLARTKTKTKLISILYGKKYQEGKASYSYMINPHYKKLELKVNTISNGKLKNKIRDYSSLIPPIVKSGKYKFLYKYFENQKLRIEFDEAVKLCNLRFKSHKDYGKYLNEMFKIANLNNNVYKFYFNEETDARLHTNITMLPRVYRRFITYDNKRLIEVDLSNSIIYFLSQLISNEVSNSYLNSNFILHMFYKSLEAVDIKEIELVREVALKGEFYDSFIMDIKKTFDENVLRDIYNIELERDDEYKGDYNQVRKIAKKKILAMIFAEPDSETYLEFNKIFKLKYPKLLTVLNSFKKDYGNKKLSHILFQLESHYLLDVVAKEFNRKNSRKAPIFTLHDCLITTVDFGDELEKVISNTLKAELSDSPKVKSKPW